MACSIDGEDLISTVCWSNDNNVGKVHELGIHIQFVEPVNE